MCGAHYQRWSKYGDPTKTVNALSGQTQEERLRHYGWTVTDVGCWEWDGYRFPKGYGNFPVGNSATGAHRVAYETWIGPIPEGHIVRHRCDSPPCINPEHLETGTHQDNMDDKVQRQRQNSIRGNAHYASKLTADQVTELRRLYAEGVGQTELSKMFGTTHKNIHMIVHNKTWRHLLDKGVEGVS